MATPNHKEALIAELASARTRMSGNFRALRYDLDVAPRVTANIERHTMAWFSSAAILGLLLSKLIPQRKTKALPVTVRMPGAARVGTQNAGKATLLLTVLKYALDFAKPTILRYLSSRFRSPDSAAR